MGATAAPFRIREVNSADHPQLVAFWQRVWSQTYGPSLGQDTLQKMLQWLLENSASGMLPGKGERAFCAESQSRLTGSVIIMEKGATSYCWGMYVDPELQRQRLGSTLLSTAISTTTEAHSVEVRVLMTSPWATAFYLAHGFKPTGTEVAEFVPGVTLERAVMSRPIDRKNDCGVLHG